MARPGLAESKSTSPDSWWFTSSMFHGAMSVCTTVSPRHGQPSGLRHTASGGSPRKVGTGTPGNPVEDIAAVLIDTEMPRGLRVLAVLQVLQQRSDRVAMRFPLAPHCVPDHPQPAHRTAPDDLLLRHTRHPHAVTDRLARRGRGVGCRVLGAGEKARLGWHRPRPAMVGRCLCSRSRLPLTSTTPPSDLACNLPGLRSVRSRLCCAGSLSTDDPRS